MDFNADDSSCSVYQLLGELLALSILSESVRCNNMAFYGLLGIPHEGASLAVKVVAPVALVLLIPAVNAYCRFSDELDK